MWSQSRDHEAWGCATSVVTSLVWASLPDFLNEVLVKEEAEGEQDHAFDEGGEEHPAKTISREWVLIGIDTVATEHLDLDVGPGQVQQAIAEAKLRENEEGMAESLERLLDELRKDRKGQNRTGRN